MSEYERPERMTREPTGDDVRQLMGASTPHFALQIRNRIRNLIWGLPPDHPARVVGEREVERLEAIAFGGEGRGAAQGDRVRGRGARPGPGAGAAAAERQAGGPEGRARAVVARQLLERLRSSR